MTHLSFEKLSQKAIRLIPKPLEKDAPRISKFGGKPWIASLKEWPLKDDGAPMDFIGQLNFNEIINNCPQITKGILAEDGILMFFLDMKGMFRSQDYYKLIYKTIPQPPENFSFPPQNLRIKPSSFIMEIFDSYPTYLDEEQCKLLGLEPEKIDNTLRDEYGNNYPRPYHQMFGHPFAAQDDPRYDLLDRLGILPQSRPLNAHLLNSTEEEKKKFEREQEEIRKKRVKIFEEENKKWLLLWQINSDTTVFSSFFGDNGLFYIFIEKEKLAKQDFSNLQLVFQT